MSLHDDLNNLQLAVGRVVFAGHAVQPDAVPATVECHRRLLSALETAQTTITAHLARTQRLGRVPGSDPIGNLTRTLNQFPKSPIAAVAPGEPTAPTDGWIRIAHAAQAVEQSARGTSNDLEPGQAWNALAAIAQVAEAVPELARQIASGARTAGQPGVAEIVNRPSAFGIQTTAREAREAIAKLRHRDHPYGPGPIPVTTPDGLEEAQQRLTELLETADVLKPGDICRIAAMAAHNAAELSERIRTRSPHIAGYLTEHARMLAKVAHRFDGRTVCRNPHDADRATMAQAHRIRQFLATDHAPLAAALPGYLAYAKSLPDLISRLHIAALKQLSNGNWGAADPHTAGHWTDLSPDTPPQFLEPLATAAAAIRQASESPRLPNTASARALRGIPGIELDIPGGDPDDPAEQPAPSQVRTSTWTPDTEHRGH